MQMSAFEPVHLDKSSYVHSPGSSIKTIRSVHLNQSGASVQCRKRQPREQRGWEPQRFA